MAVKNKISNEKRNNQKRNKLVKKGVIKSKKPKHVSKGASKVPPKVVNKVEYEDSEESDHGEDMLGMVDEDDLAFLKQSISNKSYSLLNKIKFKSAETSTDKQVNRKRKAPVKEDDELEEEYENQEVDNVKLKNLLPIKTTKGIVRMSMVDDTVEEEIKSEPEPEEEEEEKEEDEDGEEDTYELENDEFDPKKPVTMAQMLAAREKTLRLRKIHIGTLSSGLLENPEEKITNFRTLLTIMNEETAEVYITARKLATVSLLEVFKDLLPSYQLKHFDTGEVKLKKDTLQLQKYETQLLQYYKSYLVKLEKMGMVIVKKRGDSRQRTQGECKLAELAIHCMCDLLITHPYFNYSENIAQALVPYLNHRHRPIREMVNACCKTIFKQDKKGDITLKIMILINQYLRTHAHNVNVEMLDVLLALRIKEVNLDDEKEQEIKQKKLQSHKGNILRMSKKEKKRKKNLKDLEKELLETKAEENKQNKQRTMTEITKILFGIYFRILKSSTNTKVLGICLEGLAKFSHCINLDYYTDLVNVLINILKQDWIGYREQLHCIQTVLVMLSGQGEVLTLDPSSFYKSLYETLLTTHAGKNHKDFLIVLQTLSQALIRRRKKVTQQRLLGFTKRLTTLSLQLLHNGALGTLCLVRNIMQLTKHVEVLLDFDESVGDGKYLPELDDPEYCNSASTALFELIPLTKHYHPIVCKYARNIISGVPATGDGSLPPDIGNCSAEELFKQYDPTKVEFKPSVQVPKKCHQKSNPQKHQFMDRSFRDFCMEKANKRPRLQENEFNFIL